MVVQLFNSCTAFQKYIYEDHRICTALEITVQLGTSTIVNEINSQIQCTKDVQLFLWLYSFSIVVQLSENIYMRTTEFVHLWKKLYILVQTSLWMKLRGKYSVPKMDSFFFGCTGFQLLYSFLKIYIWGPQNLYSFGKKLYILVQTPLWMKLRAKYSVPKMYSFFLWMYSFLIVVQVFKNIHMRKPQNLYSFGKNCTFWYKHHCEWN